jgi:CO/xanthine dehydrogenase Mo-binding subunit
MNLEERIRVEPDGTVTALSGKIEFGQGIRTAFAQLVANELDVPVERVRVVLGDTEQVPFDFGTYGSNSVAQEAPALRRAAAFARRTLIERAAARLGLPPARLSTRDGRSDPRGRAAASAGSLAPHRQAALAGRGARHRDRPRPLHGRHQAGWPGAWRDRSPADARRARCARRRSGGARHARCHRGRA